MVLVVEDEKNIADVERLYLTRAGFTRCTSRLTGRRRAGGGLASRAGCHGEKPAGAPEGGAAFTIVPLARLRGRSGHPGKRVGLPWRAC